MWAHMAWLMLASTFPAALLAGLHMVDREWTRGVLFGAVMLFAYGYALVFAWLGAYTGQ